MARSVPVQVAVQVAVRVAVPADSLELAKALQLGWELARVWRAPGGAWAALRRVEARVVVLAAAAAPAAGWADYGSA